MNASIERHVRDCRSRKNDRQYFDSGDQEFGGRNHLDREQKKEEGQGGNQIVHCGEDVRN